MMKQKAVQLISFSAKTLETNSLTQTATQSPFCFGFISPQAFLYSAMPGFLTLIPSDPDGAFIDVDCNVSVDPFSCLATK